MKEKTLWDKIEELKGDDLAYGYKDYEKSREGLSTMEICNDNSGGCNDFVIKKIKEKISKDVKEFIKKLKEELRDTDYALDYLKEDEWELIMDEIDEKIDTLAGENLIEK